METKGDDKLVSLTRQFEQMIDQLGRVKAAGEEQLLDLVSLFVHDLESPLASMKYVLKLLEEKKLDLNKPRHQQLVASSRIAVERAESIVYDLLAVAKSTDHGMTASVEPTDLQKILANAVTLAGASAAENHIEVLVKGGAQAKVLADPRLLTRVLDNLIYNAVRHTPSGRSITVSLGESIDTVTVSVLDGGNGFGEIDPAILFEKFGQVQMRAMGKHRGVGLGLHFCQLAVRAMEGTITAANHPSGGAVFTVNLRKA